MNSLQALFFGILQGITEFLPVSSSGHLVVGRALMQIKDIPILFDVMLHVSTLVVVVIVFRKRIGNLFLSLFRFIGRRNTDSDAVNLKLIVGIIAATVVTVVIGLGISVLELETYPRIAAAFFLVTGIILILARYAGGEKGYKELGIKEALIAGLAQGFGVIPGVSRSGITISANLFAGLKREEAGEFSFLIAIPAILGATILEMRDFDALLSAMNPVAVIVGIISSFVVGLVSLIVLLRLVKRGQLYIFSIYLLPLGITLLIIL